MIRNCPKCHRFDRGAASRGASTADVMRAGNWKTARMVAHYSAGATAERGAVARYLYRAGPEKGRP